MDIPFDDIPFPTDEITTPWNPQDVAAIETEERAPATKAAAQERAATLLDQLFSLRADAEELEIERIKALKAAIPEALSRILKLIEDDFETRLNEKHREIATLEGQIKTAALTAAASTKGQSGMQVVYSAGRITWDNKGLTRYAKTHPEVSVFRVQGEPYVTIRKS